MTEPKIKAGMPFMDVKSAVSAMQDRAKKIGGSVVKEGNSIVLKNKSGKIIANVFQYTVNKNTTYRYNDWEGREYVGENTNGKYTTIYSGDGMYVARDKDGNGRVTENEIDLNM